MVISHARKFIMMAPWKTASSSCIESLRAYNESRYERFFYFNARLNRVVHQHVTLAELYALPEGQLGYKIAAFVRNPYDRAYSGFLQIQRDFRHQPAVTFQEPWIGELVRTQIAENMARVVQAGFNFDNWIKLLPEYEVFEVGRNSNMVLHPANYWTHVEGQKRVDFVGKVENFEADFSSFCEHVGIERPPTVLANISDECPGSSYGGSKYASRMSRSSLDRINDLFRQDFALFDYAML